MTDVPTMKISIITVCYNSVATIEDTLQSIARQTYPDVMHCLAMSSFSGQRIQHGLYAGTALRDSALTRLP